MVDVKSKLIEWMREPENISWEDILMLENMEKEHPYFQTIKSLIARHYMVNNHILKTKKVNTASVYSLNRNTLRNFLKIEKRTHSVSTEEVSTSEKVAETEIISLNEEIKENLEVVHESTPDTIDEVKTNIASEEIIKDSASEVKVTQEEIIKEEEEVVIQTPKDNIKTDSVKTEIISLKKENQPITPTTKEENKASSERQELLNAINKKLAELKNRKESYLKEVRSELNETNVTPLKSDINKEEAPKPKEEPLSKINPDRAINFNKLRGKLSQIPIEKPKEKSPKTLRFNKTTKKEVEPEKPKNVFSSRLGNVLSDDSSEDVDRLLDYINKTKKNKTLPVNKINQNDSIISKFINEDPSISKLTKGNGAAQSDLAKESTKKEFVSENLAIIHEKQGNFKQAVSIYKELILKFPEKKTYFVGRIEKLKNK